MRVERMPTAQEREERLKESIPRALKAWGLQVDRERLAEPMAFDRAVARLARVIRMIEEGKPHE